MAITDLQSDGPGRVIDRRNDGRGGIVGDMTRQIIQAGAHDAPGPQAAHPFSPRVWQMNRDSARQGLDEMGLGWDYDYAGSKSPNRSAGASAIDDLLTQTFAELSNRVAGGQRLDPRELLPEVGLPDEGQIPEELLAELMGIDSFDPVAWSRGLPDDISQVDVTKIKPASGPGREGKGLDFFRGGEAPNNYANRHNPLYKARRDFMVAIAPQLEELFGVSAQGSAGYMRQPSKGDAAAGGRSANSDHYSGGALDLFGTKEEMVALRNWAVNQPWVSFVRCQSESHYDHVHISADLGWIAQNFFQGQNLPPIRRTLMAPTPENLERVRNKLGETAESIAAKTDPLKPIKPRTANTKARAGGVQEF